MVSDINGEGSSPGREDGDPTEMTAAREADSSAAGAAEAQALLPPPQTLPPAQGLDSQQFAQLGSAGSPPAWPSAATPDGGSGPGYPSQPSNPWMPIPETAPVAPSWSSHVPSGWPPAGGVVEIGPTAAVLPGPMPGMKWAGIGIRLAAVIIDTVLIFVIFVVGTGVADAVGYTASGPDAGYSAPAATILWIAAGICLAYMPVCWRLFRGTPGQRAVRLRVVRAQDGETLTVKAIAIRYLIWCLCIWTVIIGIVVAIVAAGDPEKRAWPDTASDSVVVKLG
jgi:uncharacterized RDD family membrane protein YckC